MTVNGLLKKPVKACALIPVYNNHMTLEKVVSDVQQYIRHIVIVDDGSHDGTETIVDRLHENDPDHIYIFHQAVNTGKGAAIQMGLEIAHTHGFTHALQIDADGQHDINDIPRFLEMATESPNSLILGDPVYGDDIPAIRKHGRKLTTAMIALETGSLKMPDAMCGFRIYPVAATRELGRISPRMSYDPEVMIRAYWAGIPFKIVATKVRYLSAEEGGISHFRMVRDNVINIWVHTQLLLQAPLRLLLRAIKTSH
ncbi:MAG: glycosyltransferase family 2 protein [Gammaproteobacteria bacterium]